MSFFGFNTTLPRDRGHPSTAPGFSQVPDPFDAISRDRAAVEDNDDDDALNFDDTYDGLGEQLEEAGDNFNEDTFGGNDGSAALASKPPGKDFDFFGQTAKVSDAINEEQLRYNRHQAPKTQASIATQPSNVATKPTRTGYERYKDPSYVADLQVDPSLWGAAPSRPTGGSGRIETRQESYGTEAAPQSASNAFPSKKMMSLEEVEASMAAQTKRSATNAAPQQRPSVPPTSISHDLYSEASASQYGDQARYAQPQRTDPRLSQYISHQPQTAQAELPAHAGGGPQILQRVKPPSQQVSEPRNTIQTQQTQPRQILQNPDRLQSQTGPTPVEPPTQSQAHSRVPSKGPAGLPQQISMITNPQQLMQLSEEERAAFLLEDAKRAKRNHKIYLLSKDNGLMTPKDKNWVTRIQLQQLMTSTGNVNDQDPGAALSEDFYYEVHNQIRGGPRQNPHQPLNHFAQTYLHQTGGRQSGFARRQNRGGDNHLQRMEQQVQRAVEAAKLKPKNKQLVIEGSLGKISFSNAKTPKPLLNIKRTDSGDVTNRPQSSGRQPSKAKIPQTEMSASDRKTVLRNIEKVYTSLMRIEDHERHTPASLLEDSEAALIEQHIEWRHTMKTLNQRLWQDLKVMEPINPGSSIPHPFIAFLSYPKGKKTIPRIFRHLDIEQRVTILTMIVVHLDSLDVISKAQPQLNEAQLPIAVREEVELFSQVVMPSLFGYVNEAPLNIVIGLLGLVLDRVNVQAVARTKVGLGILTMLLSRAEIVKQAGATNDQEWEQWSSFYHRLFDMLEPILSGIFPGSINSGEDMYVWQFLAAMGIGASPEEQQRLVIAVKDRVMDTVVQSKALPPEMASQRLGNVNLFMRAIGLDVELLG